MDENLHNDDFEKFLQDQVKHHRMFPSDKVWRNINTNLQHHYNWPALTIAAFTFIAAIIAVSVYFSPGPNVLAIKNVPSYNGQRYQQQLSSNVLTPTIKERKRDKSDTGIQPLYVTKGNLERDLIIDELYKNNANSKESFEVKVFEDQKYQYPLKGDNSIVIGMVNTPLKSAIHEIENKEQAFMIATPAINQTQQGPVTAKSVNFVGPSSESNRLNKMRKLNYQVYITPSASYRRLKEDRTSMKAQSLNVSGPLAINYISDVNEIVMHKPGSGMEAGIRMGYRIKNKLTFTSALQVNARQYLIEAFLSAKEIATIAFPSGNGVDSLTSYSSYRTANGYEAAELTNRYYQISIPFGIDYEVIGKNAVKVNIAASLQPTYMISRNAFLISTDFKNYIESPEMTRKWNLNAAVESYLSIKSGNYNWQIGPQVRYQMLPTAQKKYPIKEYLIDYGFKIGVSKTLQ